ncbi:MAG: pyruvate kinase [Rhodospirillales bacterium]|jgi:pyruvate kinase|nr:pyruvate kinase [Rhodospirillales bacterium]
MGASEQRTKIVCTIGPASANADILAAMMDAGMDVCRLNFAHGNFDSHAATIALIRKTAKETGHRISILADLPGPKIRLGELAGGAFSLETGADVVLTTADIVGTPEKLPVQFPELPHSVGPGDAIFLNDGFLHLKVIAVAGNEVHCRVDVGGGLRSNKGVNIPGKQLPIKVFTPQDHEGLKFAVAQSLDAVSQSFVQTPEELREVRAAAREAGGEPMICAKIERCVAVDNIDAILAEADAIMVARGDLGVETPIEGIAITQKRLIQHARRAGRPVITATQMLESMIGNSRPTRAEATDVANAILDGTDCVMLSEESAMGQYPVEAVKMLANIAAATEAGWSDPMLKEALPDAFDRIAVDLSHQDNPAIEDIIAYDVAHAVHKLKARVVLAPTLSGELPALIAAYRLPCWVVAMSPNQTTCQRLNFVSGIFPVAMPEHSLSWEPIAASFLRKSNVLEGIAVIAHRWWRGRSFITNRIEVLEIGSLLEEGR